MIHDLDDARHAILTLLVVPAESELIYRFRFHISLSFWSQS